MDNSNTAALIHGAAEAAVAELKPLSTRGEVATFLRCRPRTVSKLINEGELEAVQREARGAGRRLLIPRKSVADYLRRCAR